MKTLSFLITALCFVTAGHSQEATANDPAELYFQQIANVESLIALQEVSEARSLFETLPDRSGRLEYDFLKARLIQESASVMAHRGEALSIAVNPAGTVMATGGSDSVIHLWNTDGMVKTGTLSGHEGAITSLDFSKDGRYLISGSRDKTVRLWEVREQKVLNVFTNDSWQGIYSARFDPQDSLIGVSTWTFTGGQVMGIVHLVERTSGKVRQALEPPSPHPVSALEFAPSEGVAYGTWGLAVHYYDFRQRNIKWAMNMMENHEYSAVTSLDIDPAGNTLIIGTKDSKIRLIDVASGQVRFEPVAYSWHTDEVNDVKFHPSGNLFASASNDHTIRIGKTSGGQPFTTLLGHKAGVAALAFHPDGKTLYSVARDGSLYSWNLEDLQAKIVRVCPDPGYGRGLFSMTVNNTGTQLAMACGEIVQLLSLESLMTAELDEATYYGLAFRDREEIIVGGRDGQLNRWNIMNVRKMESIPAHSGYVQKVIASDPSIAISASGKYLKVWQLNNSTEITSYEAPAAIRTFLLTPDKKGLVLCLSDKSVLILNRSNWQVLHSWREDASVTHMKLSPDGSTYALGRTDGTIRILKTGTLEEVAKFTDPEGAIAGMSFDGSGQFVISAAVRNSTTVKFWDIQLNRQVLSLHTYPDIYAIEHSGGNREFILADKHGLTYILGY